MITIDKAQEEKVALELKRAIRNINRNLYEWKNGDKAKKINFSISFTEVKSLTRTWIKRCLRDLLTHAVIDRVLGNSNLVIAIDDANLCIKQISLNDASNYSSYKDWIELIQGILKSISYEKLRYSPADYKEDGTTPSTSAFNPDFYVSLENLVNVNFNP